MIALPAITGAPLASPEGSWQTCRFLTCSVLPVRVACNLRCPFCFSRSSISALRHETMDWRQLDVAAYYRFARSRGASRLVITGGGEPLLRPDDVIHLIRLGREFFDEIACFTNGSYLTVDLGARLHAAGLSYLCYSRHHEDDALNRRLMGDGAPEVRDFLRAAGSLPVRATCVMARGHVDSPGAVWRYIHCLRALGVRQFTFKHTYVAYEHSLFQGSTENGWAAEHRVDFDPFADRGTVVARLPWGPCIRQIGDIQTCYYHEPNPGWELRQQLCRSSNLLSDGSVYASLEDQRSLLFRLSC